MHGGGDGGHLRRRRLRGGGDGSKLLARVDRLGLEFPALLGAPFGGHGRRGELGLCARAFLPRELAQVAVQRHRVVGRLQPRNLGFGVSRGRRNLEVFPLRIVRDGAKLERTLDLRGGDARGGSFGGVGSRLDLFRFGNRPKLFKLGVAKEILSLHHRGGESLRLSRPEGRIGVELAAVRGSLGGELDVDPRGSFRGIGAPAQGVHFLSRRLELRRRRRGESLRRQRRLPRRRRLVRRGSSGVPRGLLRGIRGGHGGELGLLGGFSLGA